MPETKGSHGVPASLPRILPKQTGPECIQEPSTVPRMVVPREAGEARERWEANALV